jgi:hypothetical protein
VTVIKPVVAAGLARALASVALHFLMELFTKMTIALSLLGLRLTGTAQ